ncbi:hypothetical protein HII17_10505 [Thalassotalea sp. M1531]|uniref:Uncharacterized protein n=1 Tax=Thalassotalea algicola TaxID=2716224 RepID=A0A7Y0Q711_9GAMM|nr:hypothetical protein [Thalassotalea algicola]NMP31998.1 hypothetical protein [Thalassotalea algicola]
MIKKIAVLLFILSANAYAEKPVISYDKTMTVDGYDLSYTCRGDGHPITILEPPSGIASEEALDNSMIFTLSILKT